MMFIDNVLGAELSLVFWCSLFIVIGVVFAYSACKVVDLVFESEE